MTNDALLDPLNSILKDVLSLNETLNYNSSKVVAQQCSIKRSLPTVISIESEDRPDLHTVHLFNKEGDDDNNVGNVPYTLTVREVDNKNGAYCKVETNHKDCDEWLPKCEHKGRHVNKQIELVIVYPIFQVYFYYLGSSSTTAFARFIFLSGPFDFSNNSRFKYS